jgi:SAM-dependent methyltransferase
MTGFIIGTILLIIFLPLLIAGFSGAPWVPIKKGDIGRVNKIANLKPGQKFIELGSGDGRVCHFVAKNNPKVDVIGVELSWFMVVVSRIRVILDPVGNLKIELGNAFKTDISGADVIFFYFLPHSMEKKLQKELINEMKPGAKAISYVFDFKEWPGEHSIDKSSDNTYPINIYRRSVS